MEQKIKGRSLIIHVSAQQADLREEGSLYKSFQISTAKAGTGCEEGSYCTPTGSFKIAERIGEGLPCGAVLKSREPTGDIWQGRACEEDLILTRILWLEGIDAHNANTQGRYIYLHGTNHEDKLGEPHSHGCIRFSNKDIIEVFDSLSVGDIVEISKD